MLDDSLLDDQSRLTDADREGLLRAAARAGAQVRATAEAADDLGVDRVFSERPRALVLVTRPGVGGAIAGVVTALLGTRCPVPVVVADDVPTWVGALDVVLAHSEDPGDVRMAESIDRVARRGARVLLTAEPDGPVAASAAQHALLIPPRVPVPQGFGFARGFAAWLVALKSLGLLDVDVQAVADELDREAERCHPMHESFVNPAKTLALRIAERTPLLWGLDDLATAVAAHGAEVLATYAGVVSDVAGYPQALTRSVLHRRAVRGTSGADLFADPDDEHDGLVRAMLVAVRRGPQADFARRVAMETLSGADVLEPAEEVSGGEAVCAALLALRFELAALYLGLAAGTLGGPGLYAPAV
ncbi:phosphoglucose isomerase-like protein [Saccharothrix carnea]|uniref:Phosphoglucose isomerase-like protein n=1 Tax=Saccharothrix carnea TaxID=1280637 RepID=A0A2P8I7N8_SACCR|nr:SIS domain-containing protein [Saccharothrix carnea]PSL54491.1 phosphoglucose isomerase-like protein [Saccharothrix carnea]